MIEHILIWVSVVWALVMVIILFAQCVGAYDFEDIDCGFAIFWPIYLVKFFTRPRIYRWTFGWTWTFCRWLYKEFKLAIRYDPDSDY